MTLYTIFLLLSLCAGYAHSNQEELIIVINGTSCAGKSTLTHALADALKEQQFPVHECSAEECFSMTLPHHADRTWCVVHTDDIWEYICNQEQGGDCWQQAIAKTAQYACYLADEGCSVIVDTSIIHEEDFELFGDSRLYTILVYAPLSVLCMRDEQRAEQRHRPYHRKIVCRYHILECFKQMYRPAYAEDVVIDCLEYTDLLSAAIIPESREQFLIDPHLHETLDDLFQYFDVDPLHACIKIAPSIAHDLIVFADEPIVELLPDILLRLS